MTALPSLFITHGAPTLVLDPCPAGDFLRGLTAGIDRPRAILCVSAHWEESSPTATGTAAPETIHDFFGFPEEMYALSYPAPGAPELAQRVLDLLGQAGLGGRMEPLRGLDHGAWVPLSLAWPAADIPVVQLSVQTALGPAHHLALGQALAPLKQDGVLILASGSATHNLRDWHGHRLDGPPADYAAAFADWLDEAVLQDDRGALVDYLSTAPEAQRNHPTPEHFLPLFVALGAGLPGTARKLHGSYTYGVFYMGAYAFD
ncbi:MAG: class III extradiol ring-cleavage dioxygenase [Alphaproteobacteria bacterium]|nr:class III extradiol ring-cleavage dioxygenase [Alphaproteobacteria bacterium]